MKNKLTIVTLLCGSMLLIFVFLGSCKYDKPSLPVSIGKPSEIIVVTNNKAQWNSVIGDTLVQFFYQEMPGLPQPEPMFTLVNIPEESFIDMYKTNRSIFIIDINPSFKKPQIETRENLWAKPQRVIKITAPNTNSFLDEFEKDKDWILEAFVQNEHERLLQAYRFVEDRKITEALKNSFGINMVIPGGFSIAEKTRNFMWIRKETLTNSQGIIIYTYDYTDTNAFNPEFIINYRNKVTEAYIPGPADSSFMIVSEQFVLPVFQEVNFNDVYAVETRGLWELENDFMGGPFISYTLVDERKQKIMTIDAYVFAPSEEKRDLVRELEAILNSLTFVDVNEKE